MNRTTKNMYPKPLLFSDYALLLTNNINPSDNQFAGATDDWYVLYNEAWNRDLHCYGESMHSAFKQWILNSLSVYWTFDCRTAGSEGLGPSTPVP